MSEPLKKTIEDCFHDQPEVLEKEYIGTLKNFFQALQDGDKETHQKTSEYLGEGLTDIALHIYQGKSFLSPEELAEEAYNCYKKNIQRITREEAKEVLQ